MNAWHYAKGSTWRRCCKCHERIGNRAKYWGSSQHPDQVLCVPCKTGHAVRMEVKLAP